MMIAEDGGQTVSTSVPNLVKISQRVAELWRFMCFKMAAAAIFNLLSVLVLVI